MWIRSRLHNSIVLNLRYLIEHRIALVYLSTSSARPLYHIRIENARQKALLFFQMTCSLWIRNNLHSNILLLFIPFGNRIRHFHSFSFPISVVVLSIEIVISFLDDLLCVCRERNLACSLRLQKNKFYAFGNETQLICLRLGDIGWQTLCVGIIKSSPNKWMSLSSSTLERKNQSQMEYLSEKRKRIGTAQSRE